MDTGPAQPIVEINDLEFCWRGAGGFKLSIEHFALARGSRTLLIGPSGSGKSTFLSLLCGVAVPGFGGTGHGSVLVLGRDLSAMGSSARDRFRAEHFGIIFQMFNLLPYGSVIDNITLPLNFSKRRAARLAATGGGEVEARRLAHALGLGDEVLSRSTVGELSVGQQQRVAAARALIGQPDIVVADEPTSALDRNRQDEFLALLFSEVAAAGATLLMVSHDESLGRLFDQTVRLDAFARTSFEAAA